jgi:hypothetical protein
VDQGWIQAFKASVGWADQIQVETLGDLCYCSAQAQGKTHAWYPGWIATLDAAIAQGQRIRDLTGHNVTIQFLDRDPEERQVEASLHATAHAGLGCDFLEARPRVALTALLAKYSEGTLFDRLAL